MFPQRDSNSGPLDHKTDALPTELILQETFGQKNFRILNVVQNFWDKSEKPHFSQRSTDRIYQNWSK